MPPDPYGNDILAGRRRGPLRPTEVPATTGLAVRHDASGFTGRVAGIEAGAVLVRDQRGRERAFPLRETVFRVDGRLVVLTPPRAAPPAGGSVRTASGSIAGTAAPARVARASRVYVEGVHDAELVEKVWGDDLREAGIVVEPLDGADNLPAAVRAFAPGPGRRLGVLLDHLVPGSKEQRIAAAVEGPAVLVTGHPYVDVWQGVRPRAIGIAAWPVVPPGRPWKEGVCAALGGGDPPAFWRRVLRGVRSYADLEQPLVGAVERLLDFVTDV
jgi:Protein of unknown function (DUF3097)